jgi:hypothetical protein
MRALLVRVGADSGSYGGRWNAPVDPSTGDFAYVCIPEKHAIRAGMERPYSLVSPALARLKTQLPSHLSDLGMHLDPDFEHLSYGDWGGPGAQLAGLEHGDWLVFFSGLRDIHPPHRLIYGLIGLLIVDHIDRAGDVPQGRRDFNAHTRRFPVASDDIVVWGASEGSGRLDHCIPIGSLRAPIDRPMARKSYRVDSQLLERWGGLRVHDGWIQRKARFPEFLDAAMQALSRLASSLVSMKAMVSQRRSRPSFPRL